MLAGCFRLETILKFFNGTRKHSNISECLQGIRFRSNVFVFSPPMLTLLFWFRAPQTRHFAFGMCWFAVLSMRMTRIHVPTSFEGTNNPCWLWCTSQSCSICGAVPRTLRFVCGVLVHFSAYPSWRDTRHPLPLLPMLIGEFGLVGRTVPSLCGTRSRLRLFVN